MPLTMLPTAARHWRQIVLQQFQHLGRKRYGMEFRPADTNDPVTTLGSQILLSVDPDFETIKQGFLRALFDPKSDFHCLAVRYRFAKSCPRFYAWKSNLGFLKNFGALMAQRCEQLLLGNFKILEEIPEIHNACGITIEPVHWYFRGELFDGRLPTQE
jgi:hypothetical protein